MKFLVRIIFQVLDDQNGFMEQEFCDTEEEDHAAAEKQDLAAASDDEKSEEDSHDHDEDMESEEQDANISSLSFDEVLARSAALQNKSENTRLKNALVKYLWVNRKTLKQFRRF